MKASSLTDIGAEREMNQDYFYSSEESVGSLPSLFIVADGMGGHRAGEFASRYAVEAIVRKAKTLSGRGFISILNECIVNANLELLEQSSSHPEMRGMGTTVVAAVLDGHTLIVANVGDSRLYVIGDKIRQITRDHSLVQEMVRIGEIDPEEARSHPDRHIITRAVGVESHVQADIFETVLNQGERVLLCSDGLTNMVEDSDILRAVNGPGSVSEKTEQLVALANKNGGRDNITVILIEPEEPLP